MPGANAGDEVPQGNGAAEPPPSRQGSPEPKTAGGRPWIAVTQGAVGAIAGVAVTAVAFGSIGLSVKDLEDRVRKAETSVTTTKSAAEILNNEIAQSERTFIAQAKLAIDNDIAGRKAPFFVETRVDDSGFSPKETRRARYCALSTTNTYSASIYVSSICDISYNSTDQNWTLSADKRNKAGSRCRMVCIGL